MDSSLMLTEVLHLPFLNRQSGRPCYVSKFPIIPMLFEGSTGHHVGHFTLYVLATLLFGKPCEILCSPCR